MHHVLPFLPSTKEVLSAHLAQCSQSLRNAFAEALNSAIGSFAVRNVQGSLANANKLLAEFEAEGGKHSRFSDLIHLQCLILMLINTDNCGPASLRGEHEGPAKSTLLGRAAGVAYAMSVPQEAIALGEVDDLESDQCIRVRAWWTLVILDRWNALSTATPLIISGDTVVLPHNLKPIVGEANYRFTRKFPIQTNARHHANMYSSGIHHGALGARIRPCSFESDPGGWSQSCGYFPSEYGDVARSFPRRHPFRR